MRRVSMYPTVAAISRLNPIRKTGARARSSGAPDPGGPQALAGPTALWDSAGRSDLLRCASARSPLAAGGLDSRRPLIGASCTQGSWERPKPHARTTTALAIWMLREQNERARHDDLC